MKDTATLRSRERRAWYRRLTPAAWVSIGVGVLICTVCGHFGVIWALSTYSHPNSEWTTGTATPKEGNWAMVVLIWPVLWTSIVLWSLSLEAKGPHQPERSCPRNSGFDRGDITEPLL